MSSRAHTVLIAVLLIPLQVLGLVAANAAPQTDATNDRATFGIGPASLGQADPRAYFSYQTGPGGSYRDQAAVLNYGAASLHLSLYVADLGNAPNGQVFAGLAQDTLRDAGRWLSIPSRFKTVDVPPRNAAGPGRVTVPLTLQVPTTASPGDHGAALVAVLSTLGRNPKGQNVRLDQRVASRIYVRVSGPVRAQLEIVGLHASYRQAAWPWGRGRTTVTYRVRNAGNVRLSVSQQVQVGTWLAGVHTVDPPDIPLLFPGAQQAVTLQVSGVVPTLRGRAAVTVTPHLFTDQPPQPLTRATAHVGFWAVPWVLLGCVALAVLILLALRALLRRRPRGRHATPRRPASPPTRPDAGAARPEVTAADAADVGQLLPPALERDLAGADGPTGTGLLSSDGDASPLLPSLTEASLPVLPGAIGPPLRDTRPAPHLEPTTGPDITEPTA